MANNDVKIKLSLDGDKLVIDGLKGVGDGASEADSKLGSFINGGLKGAGVALAGLAVAGVAAGAALSGAVISSYADYEQNLGGIETMFKDSSGKMVAYANEAYKTAGLSANEYMSQVTSFSASLLQGLGGDTEAAADAANLAMVDMSDNANKFGTNIGDIQNAYQGFAKQNFTMLDNLKLGYGGTKEEMQRLMDDASKLPAAMGQEFDLNNFADVTKAINLIQDEMGIAGTTALEASETISGSIGMLKGSFDNLLTGLGSADADVATLASNVIESLQTVVTNVGPVIENLGSNMAMLGPQLGTMMEGLIGTVSSAIPGLLSAGVSMIGGLIQGISSALPALITALVPAIVSLVEMISTQLPLLVDAGMKAVIALGQGLVQALPTLLPMIVSMVTGIVSAIIENLPMLLDTGLQLILALAEGLVASIPVLIEALPQIIQSIVTMMLSSTPMILQAALELFMGIVLAIPEIIVALTEALPTIITAVIDGVIGAIPQMIESGIALFLGLIGALPAIIGGLVVAIPQIIDALVNTFGSNSTLMADTGHKLLIALVQQIGPATATITGEITKILNGITGTVLGGIGDMASAGGDLIRGLWQGISDTVGWLMDKIGGFVDDVVSGIKSFFGIASPSRLFRDEIGKMLVAGTGIGITANADLVLNPVEDLNKALTVEAKKISRLELAPAVGLGQNAVASPQAMPITYTAMPTILASQTVTLDTRQMRTILEDIVASGIAAQDIDINNNISMYDRDPRIVGKQLGRTVKGVLVG